MADGGTIDSLQIDISAESHDAAQRIEELTTALRNMKDVAKGGAGLTATKNQLQKLNTALSGITNNLPALDKLNNTLRSAGSGSSGMDRAATALNNVAKAAKATRVDYSSLAPQIESVAKQFGQLPSSVQKTASAMGRAKNAIGSLAVPKVAPSLNETKAALYSLSVASKNIGTSMKSNAASIQSVSSAFASLPPSVQRAVLANAKLEASNNKTAKSYGMLGTGISSAVAKLGIYAYGIRRIVGVAADWVTSANKYIENVNLFQVSMGEFYDEAFVYAELVNKKLGIDPSEWMRNQGVFMSMAKGVGLADEKAYQLSKGLTELSYDISSLYNEDVTTSAQRLQSALAGEIEPIRRLGISITQATLQEYALSKGITEAVTAMTEQEKALLRSLKIIEDSDRIGTIGDFARTLESPANALRVLNQQITQMGRALGTVLLPIITQVIPWVQAFVTVITDAIKALATFVGFAMPEWEPMDWENQDFGFGDVEEAIDGATDATKEFKRQLMGIDELTVLQEPSASGSGSGGGISDWANNLEIPDVWSEQILEEITSKSTKIVEEFGDEIKAATELALELSATLAAIRIASSVVRNIQRFVGYLQRGNSELTNWERASRILSGGILLVIGVKFSYEGGYAVGKSLESGADVVAADIIKSVTGPLMTGLGGFMIGSAIPIPGAGVVGAVIGFTIGIIAEIVGYIEGKKQGLIDKFWESPAGQELTSLNEELSRVMSVNANIRLELEGLNGSIDPETLGVLNQAKDLINDIFTLDAKENKTADEIESIKTKIGILNGLNLDGIQLEYDDLRQKVIGSRDAIEEVITRLYEQYKLEALEDQIKQAYVLQVEAELNYKKGMGNVADQHQILIDAMQELNENKLLVKEIREELEAMEEAGRGIGAATFWTDETIERYEELKDALVDATDKTSYLETAVFLANESYRAAVNNLTDLNQTYEDTYSTIDWLEDNYLSLAREISSKSEEIVGDISSIGGVLDDKSANINTNISGIGDAYSDLAATIEGASGEIIESFGRITSSIDGTRTNILAATGNVSTNYSGFANSITKNNENLVKSFGELAAAMNIVGDSLPTSGGGTGKFKVSFDAFASGGFPTQGEMFIARESGPEMVGRIGNRTAVANTDQIVQGIATGVGVANEDVVNAVMAIGSMIVRAIQDNSGTPVYIGGREVTRSQNYENRMYGKTLQNV